MHQSIAKWVDSLDSNIRNEVLSAWDYNSSRLGVNVLKLPASALSVDGSDRLHCVEVKTRYQQAFIRVISSIGHGVNIRVMCETPELYSKVRDLRFLIRNRDAVYVTFPEIFVHGSKNIHCNHELNLCAPDFEILN